MIEPGHKKLSARKQARLLGVNRNRLKRKPHPPRADRASDEEALAALDRLHVRWPFYGQRKQGGYTVSAPRPATFRIIHKQHT
jgi:hypothetical protein